MVERDRVLESLQGSTLRSVYFAEGGVSAGAGHERGIDQTVRPGDCIEQLGRFEQLGPLPGLKIDLDPDKVGLRFDRNLVSQQQRRLDLFVASGGKGRLR